MNLRRRDPLRETVVPLSLLAGDTIVTFGALSLAYWLRYHALTGQFGMFVPDASFTRYLPLLLLGLALLLAAFAQFELYDSRALLRRYQSLNAIVKGAFFWLVVYLGVSLVLKFDPPISRAFVVLAFFCVVFLLYLWRSAAHAWLTHSRLLPRLQRRAVILGWNADAQQLARDIASGPLHPFTLAGVVTLPGSTPPFTLPAAKSPVRELGAFSELETILRQELADILIVARFDLPKPEVQRVVAACERAYVELKIVPGAFDIFLSGLRLQTIGRVPVLGIEELAINRLFYRVLKRLIDIVGALLGLAISAPIIAVLAALIKRESPDGPVFFRQERIGAGHRPFTLYKLRSMRPDAARSDTASVSTPRADPRLLNIGAFLRRWNLDELPQFWNVLRGEMSLVGPRPERPHHVEQLAETIAHYLPRHLVKPGMTGWAQVNGLRGGSAFEQRVQHDIYYIENWSPWLDLQILLLTFVRWRAPE